MIREVVAGIGMGFVSALVPVVNAEAVQAGLSLLEPPHLVAVSVVALAGGQTVGKTVIFGAARRGVGRCRLVHVGRPPRGPRWVRRVNATLLRCLSHRVAGPATVAVSATVGLPPLALVSAAAGASTLRWSVFASGCFVGRLVRFGAVAGGVAVLVG
ncbi:MAG TPA: hypothetical protein PLP61_03365 [Nocardioides sp.]|uniref:hypothetical protein n=1 Tax=Nocardioides sp. TaxID=35761 RepID=UPI002C7771D6|nr:hypothetical protein [Nocardioides sp.]HQR26058.1 hypothetical protein [Nocardioides sp.]